MSSSAPNDSQNGAPTKTSLDSDFALLQKILSEDIDEPNPEAIAELLGRLEAAEGLADGVEERLDGIIDHLDTLLSDLEGMQTAGAVAEVDVRTVEVATEGTARSDPAGQNAVSK